jgi:A/G-specific adenine glycosylase
VVESEMHKIKLQAKLRTWFRKNKRPLPWREGKDWYHIWISEIMLQQTQVDTVIPYFHRFIKKFKTIQDLAKSSQQEVLKIWEGLGYYSRARNLHQAAKIIVLDYNSKLPKDREELLKIPGFGPYTTNAVLSIAYNQPYGVMDGNVKRVLSRLYAIREDIRKPKTLHTIQQLMDDLLPIKFPGEFNESIMELGAMICKPSSPLCPSCPISSDCQAYHKNLVGILPHKSPKPAVPTRQSLACIIWRQNRFLLVKRPQHEMLAGLWEFPVLSMNDGKQKTDKDLDSIRDQLNIETSFIKSWPAIKHAYTHFNFKLHSKLFESTSNDFRSDFYDDYKWLELIEIKKFPLHKAMWKVLTKVEGELVSIAERNIVNR